MDILIFAKPQEPTPMLMHYLRVCMPHYLCKNKIHRVVVMNPFSHYELEKPVFEAELKATIKSVEKLIAIDPNSLKKISIEQPKKEIIDLKKEPVDLKIKLKKKDDLVRELGRKLKAK